MVNKGEWYQGSSGGIYIVLAETHIKLTADQILQIYEDLIKSSYFVRGTSDIVKVDRAKLNDEYNLASAFLINKEEKSL